MDSPAAGASRRPGYVNRLAEARNAREQVLRRREPASGLTLTEKDILRRAGGNELSHLQAAISRNQAPVEVLPSLEPQHDAPEVQQRNWFLLMIPLGLAASAAATYFLIA